MSIVGNATAQIRCDGLFHVGPNPFVVTVGVDRTANDGLREAGWSVSKDGQFHTCPGCREFGRRRN